MSNPYYVSDKCTSFPGSVEIWYVIDTGTSHAKCWFNMELKARLVASIWNYLAKPSKENLTDLNRAVAKFIEFGAQEEID